MVVFCWAMAGVANASAAGAINAAASAIMRGLNMRNSLIFDAVAFVGSPHGLPTPARAWPFGGGSGNDHGAHRDALPIGIDIEQVKRVAEHDHDEDPDHALVERAFAALE